MTKDQKQQLYLLVSDLQSNLVRLHASGTTGTIMDESLDIINKMMGYFIISGTEQETIQVYKDKISEIELEWKERRLELERVIKAIEKHKKNYLVTE